MGISLVRSRALIGLQATRSVLPPGIAKEAALVPGTKVIRAKLKMSANYNRWQLLRERRVSLKEEARDVAKRTFTRMRPAALWPLTVLFQRRALDTIGLSMIFLR